jgi:hypothetical protein
MEPQAQKPRQAWQPLTAGGVAAFASARSRRLFVAQVAFAILASLSLIWCVGTAWFPVIREAIGALPDRGEIRSGKLIWPEDSSRRLAGNRFLSVAVDLDHAGGAVPAAHIQVEIGRSDVKLISFLGYSQWRYPPGWSRPFNRPALAPWWGAWSPAFLALLGLASLFGLLASWFLLANLYAVPVWIFGFFLNRDLNIHSSWRLAGAAMLPACLFMSAAIFFYSLSLLDAVRLVAAMAGHFLIGWGYCVAGVIARPKHADALAEKKNPFAESSK